MFTPRCGITTNFESFDLVRQMESRAWQAMAPNYVNEEDLLPASLDPQKVTAIAKTVVHAVNTGDRSAMDLSNYAKVSLIPDDMGMTKRSYEVATNDGRIVAQVMSGRSRNPTPAIDIPLLPHFTMIRSGESERSWEYNDPRTYLQVPLTHGLILQFQEHAGSTDTSWGPFAAVRKAQVRQRAIEAIHEEFVIDAQDRSMPIGETKRQKNILAKPGIDTPLAISIRFIERNEPGKEIAWRHP